MKTGLQKTPDPTPSIFQPGFSRTITKAILRFFMIFACLLVFVESFARLPAIQSISPYRSLGLWYYPFEVKWYRLEQYIQKHGGVDVILLGSSLVNTGFVPEEIASVFQNETGERLRIFNFGIDGMTIAPNSAVARILVEHFHPKLLIFVTEIRDYDAGNGLEVEKQFMSKPWVRYQTGTLDVRGWIIDHSAALQVYLPYRNWLSIQFADSLRAYLDKFNAVSDSGYEPDNAKMTQILPTLPEQTAELPLDDSRLAKLQSILALGNGQTQMAILEMPVAPQVYLPYGGETAHVMFRDWVAKQVQAGNGVFIPIDSSLIPTRGRSNEVHLNRTGAPILSAYLGKQLALLAQQQIIHLNIWMK